MSPINFSTCKVWKVLLQLNTSKSSGPDGIPAIVLKSCPLNSLLFSTSFSNFPRILVISFPLGISPTISLSPKRWQIWPFKLLPYCNHFSHLYDYGDHYHQTTACSPWNKQPSFWSSIWVSTSQIYQWPSNLCCSCLVLCSRILRWE